MEAEYKQVYVVGHRNPDADSLVAAHAYARLKNLQGVSNVIAIRSGAANSQSEYIFQRFVTPLPQLMPDVIPKVMHHMQENPICINQKDSLWSALQIITKEGIDTLPIVDEAGLYVQLLCYESISLYIMKKTSVPLRSMLISSLHLIKSTINAQSLLEFDTDVVRGYTLLVATSYSQTFKDEFDRENPQNLIVLIGDRIDLQRYIIERRVAMMIVTNNYILTPELRTLAQENRVSVLVSSHDAASTSVMLLYSVPVSQAAIDTEAIAHDVPLSKAKNLIEHSTARAVAVVNNQREVIGLLKEMDLNRKPNIALILVDHNELGQGIPGIEKVDIIEIVDHHRLGGFKSSNPMAFINQIVGSTCTIITNLYKTLHVPLDVATASLLLCGILSDTLGLKSATTTTIDEETANYLASLTQLSIQALAQELREASNLMASHSPQEIIGMDRKEYQEAEWKFYISQIETSDPDLFIKQKDLYLPILERYKVENSALFCALLITDTATLSSYLIIQAEEIFLNLIPYPKHTASIYFLQNVLSRKKQLIPLISEMIDAL
jgi:manganese-dependent inorganic pyrophosphatase